MKRITSLLATLVAAFAIMSAPPASANDTSGILVVQQQLSPFCAAFQPFSPPEQENYAEVVIRNTTNDPRQVTYRYNFSDGRIADRTFGLAPNESKKFTAVWPSDPADVAVRVRFWRGDTAFVSSRLILDETSDPCPPNT